MAEVVRRVRRWFATERMSKADVVAGIPGAIGGVPDGMAAGVSPVHGLYASMVGRFFGGFGTSTQLMGKVALPTLAAILMVAAARSIDPDRVAAIWSSGAISRTALLVTFFATLLLPVTAAVGVGVGLSLLLQLNQEALDLKVVRLRVGAIISSKPVHRPPCPTTRSSSSMSTAACSTRARARSKRSCPTPTARTTRSSFSDCMGARV
ncbi:hypothetical protein [Nocardia fluminea]|uniref:hypothetical protein n=1 Tax=Nocardia fluminea TaxID=134984 RepID=UPI003D111DA2